MIRPVHCAVVLVACAACATGCTGIVWSQALDPAVDVDGTVGIIPAAAPGEPDRLFVRYSEESVDFTGPPTVYAVALVDPPQEGEAVTVHPQDLRPVSAAQFRRSMADPGWRDVVGHYGAIEVDTGFTALTLRTVNRVRGDERPRPPRPPPGEPDGVAARWDRRVVRLPDSVRRPARYRVSGTATAALLTPGTLVLDTVMAPLMLFNALFGPRS